MHTTLDFGRHVRAMKTTTMHHCRMRTLTKLTAKLAAAPPSAMDSNRLADLAPSLVMGDNEMISS